MIPSRIVTAMEWLDLSLGDVSRLTGKAVSKSQIHRILRGKIEASASERMHLCRAVSAALSERSDSAFWFCGAQQTPGVPRGTSSQESRSIGRSDEDSRGPGGPE